MVELNIVPFHKYVLFTFKPDTALALRFMVLPPITLFDETFATSPLIGIHAVTLTLAVAIIVHVPPLPIVTVNMTPPGLLGAV